MASNLTLCSTGHNWKLGPFLLIVCLLLYHTCAEIRLQVGQLSKSRRQYTWSIHLPVHSLSEWKLAFYPKRLSFPVVKFLGPFPFERQHEKQPDVESVTFWQKFKWEWRTSTCIAKQMVISKYKKHWKTIWMATTTEMTSWIQFSIFWSIYIYLLSIFWGALFICCPFPAYHLEACGLKNDRSGFNGLGQNWVPLCAT